MEEAAAVAVLVVAVVVAVVALVAVFEVGRVEMAAIANSELALHSAALRESLMDGFLFTDW